MLVSTEKLQSEFYVLELVFASVSGGSVDESTSG
jgi:hypothetical protein